MLIAGLMSVLALADPSADPDVIVSTAPANTADVAAAMAAPALAPSSSPTAQDATPHGLTTEEQIHRWISARAPAESFEDAVAAAETRDDRQMHGMVEAGIGTGGYRSYGAAVSLPIGENGRLDLSYSEGKNDYFGYRPGYWGPAYGAWNRPYDTRSRSIGLGFNWSRDQSND